MYVRHGLGDEGGRGEGGACIAVPSLSHGTSGREAKEVALRHG